MLNIRWDFARQLWQGKRIIIQMTGVLFVAWSGTISKSYYEPVGTPLPKPDLHDLRIIYDNIFFIHRFPNWRVPLNKWHRLSHGPHLIVPSRITDLCVTESDDSGIPGGDLWCMFEIPENHRVPNVFWHKGYLIVQMEEMRGQMLAAARQQKAMHFRRF
ncbi:MAG: hypothetical protein Q7S34_02190 [bacterium]|nr:hypothetical protein [bacterium]